MAGRGGGGPPAPWGGRGGERGGWGGGGGGRGAGGGTSGVQADKEGRVALPGNLREFAHLEREVMVGGLYSRIEIWARDRWNELDRLGAEALTESDELPDFGI